MAAVLAVAPAYRIEDVMMMRADVAVSILTGKSRLIEAAMQESRRGSSSSSGRDYEDGPGGMKIYKINSMDKLRSFLTGGLPVGAR